MELIRLSGIRIVEGTGAWNQKPNRLWRYEGIDPISNAEVWWPNADDFVVFRGHEEGRWHVSLSGPQRYPTWDEIADARYDLCPIDIEMAMFLPEPKYYVNLNPWVFHVWEVRDPDRVKGAFGEPAPFEMERSRETEMVKRTRELRHG